MKKEEKKNEKVQTQNLFSYMLPLHYPFFFFFSYFASLIFLFLFYIDSKIFKM